MDNLTYTGNSEFKDSNDWFTLENVKAACPKAVQDFFAQVAIHNPQFCVAYGELCVYRERGETNGYMWTERDGWTAF